MKIGTRSPLRFSAKALQALEKAEQDNYTCAIKLVRGDRAYDLLETSPQLNPKPLILESSPQLNPGTLEP